jgi:hypothetical protein
MGHTVAQVIGAICSIACGWIAFGWAGVGLVGGLILIIGSIVIEASTRKRGE